MSGLETTAKPNGSTPYTIPILVLTVSTVILSCLVFWWEHPLRIGADQACYLVIGRLILQGKIPYADFVDFNPPLIMYLNVIPVGISQLLHVPAPLALNVLLWVVHVCVTLVSAIVIIRYRKQLNLYHLLPVLIVFALLPHSMDRDYGQREHLFVLFTFPWLLTRGLVHARGTAPAPIAIPSALLAAIGMLLKPQFAFIAVMTEIGFLLGSKRARLAVPSKDLYVIVSIGFLYCLVFFALPKDSMHTYFSRWLPMYLDGITIFSRPFITRLCSEPYFRDTFLLFAIALGLAPAFRKRSPWVGALSFFSIASMIVYIQGSQAWTYRIIPMAFAVQSLLALESGILLQWVTARKSSARMLLILCATLLFVVQVRDVASKQVPIFAQSAGQQVWLASHGIKETATAGDIGDAYRVIVSNTSATDKVLILGQGLDGVQPLCQSGRLTASRYIHGQAISFALSTSSSNSTKQNHSLYKLMSELAQDIASNQPKLILIDQMLNMELIKHAGFSQQCLSRYRQCPRNADIFVVYLKND